MVKVVREPLFQFLVLGFLIWGVVEYRRDCESRYVIHVGTIERQRCTQAYLQQFGQMPTPQQLQSMLDRYVHDEVYVREGRALALDRDDEIVRRRIVQKYGFLQTDSIVVAEPDEQILRRWWEQNKARYLVPETVVVSQVYFSPDTDSDAGARARAAKVLERLRAVDNLRTATLGEPFPGSSSFGELSQAEAVRLFGESELAQRLFDLPTAQWSGPFRSGYGWHLVWISARKSAMVPRLADIRSRVLTDYMDEQRLSANERAFQQLRAKYSIREDDARQ